MKIDIKDVELCSCTMETAG